MATKKIIKKPLMKKGGVKKPLRKAQAGISVGPYAASDLPPASKDKNIYAGPINEKETKAMDERYPSTVGKAPIMGIQGTKKTGYISPKGVEAYYRRNDENYLRSNDPNVQSWNALKNDENKDGESYPTTKNSNFKKGGSMKKMQKGGTSKMKKYDDGGILTPQGRLKSKKVRDVSIHRFGDSSATVSKTKKDGSTVTKKVTGTRGYVPTASMSKTVTDKEGNVVSNENKSIGYNKAVRKMGRVARNVGRNENDTWAYKTGGMVNSNAKTQVIKKAGSKGVKSGTNTKTSVSKVARGRVGGTSTVPRTATPKAKMGMVVRRKK